MWYVFLWLCSCNLIAFGQNDNHYLTSYKKSILNGRRDFNKRSPGHNEYFNNFRTDNYFPNQPKYFRHLYLNSPSNLRNLWSLTNPFSKRNRMNEAVFCGNNHLEDPRREAKRCSRRFYSSPQRNYGQYFKYPFSINTNPYYEFNGYPPDNSLEFRKGISLEDSGYNGNNQKDLEIEEHKKPSIEGTAKNSSGISSSAKPLKTDYTNRDKSKSHLIFPSDIIIKNLGPWYSKSEKEILSKNVGSLAMIYEPEKQVVPLEDESKKSSDVQDSSYRCHISVVRKTEKQPNLPTHKYGDKYTFSTESQAITASDSNFIEVENNEDPLQSVQTTCTKESFDFFDTFTTARLENDEFQDSSSSPKQQENINHFKIVIEEDDTPELSTLTESSKSQSSEKHASNDDDFDEESSTILPITTSLKCENNYVRSIKKIKASKMAIPSKCSSSSFTDRNLYNESISELHEYQIESESEPENESTNDECCCCGNDMTLYQEYSKEKSSIDEPITYNFEDYVCECRKKEPTTTQKIEFLKKMLTWKSKVLKHDCRQKEERQLIPEYCYEESLNNLRSGDGDYDQRSHNSPSFKKELNKTDGNERSKNILSECKDIPRTKRNILKWFRRHPKRKRKREFVSSEDFTDDSVRHKEMRKKRIKKPNKGSANTKTRHTTYQVKNRNSHTKACNFVDTNINGYIFPPENILTVNRMLNGPKTNMKRAFVSYEGYSEKSCANNITPSTATPDIFVDNRLTTVNSDRGQTIPEEPRFSLPTITVIKNRITEDPGSSTIFTSKHISMEETRKTTHKLTTYSLHLVPDTGNRHPAKLACEQLYHVECICFTETLILDLNNIVSRSIDKKSLLQDITYYNCTDYRPINVSFTLSSALKPRLITKKHKELIVDEEHGPKEIIPETFQDLLWRRIPNEGVDFYIFPSTSIQIPCFTHNDIQLSPNVADSTKYEWKHGNHKPITEGRVTEDANHKGMLQIKDATVVDSDNYTCTVSYINPDTEELIRNTFVHTVMVVALPKLALHVLLHYNAAIKCDQETLEMFELYLPQQIEEMICNSDNLATKICTIEIHNPLCHGKDIQVLKEGPRPIWKMRSRWIRQLGDTSEEVEGTSMEMSLNYELDMLDLEQAFTGTVDRTRCNPFCQLKLLLKLIEILRDSIVVALSHPVNSSRGVTFEPDLATLNLKVLIACDGGLKLFQGFCIPCPLHTFSGEGSTECTPCPKWTYQPRVGSKRCEKCPHPFEPGCSSLWTSPYVIIIFLVCALVILLIVGCMMYCVKRLFGRKSVPVKIKNSKSSDDVKRDSTRKHDLRRKRKRISSRYFEDSSEPPPTLPSEDFTR